MGKNATENMRYQGVAVPDSETSYETSLFKSEIGHLIRPRRRTRTRPRNRKQFKSIEDEHEDEDEEKPNVDLNKNPVTLR